MPMNKPVNILRWMSIVISVSIAIPHLGCSGTQTPRNLSYSDRARREYEAGMEQLNNGSITDAADTFRRVRRDFGWSRWAWLSELRLADVDFRQEKYTDARSAYRNWIRYHAREPEAVYARFMIARCSFAEIPTDWFLAPSASERDPSPMNDAEEAFQRFLADNADSDYAADARDYLRRVRALLAREEINVAQFYVNRGRPNAAVSRLQNVLDHYSDSGLAPEALERLGETYLVLNQQPNARGAFQRILRDYATSTYVEIARRYLAFIGPGPSSLDEEPTADTPPATPARPSPPAGRETTETPHPRTGNQQSPE